MTSVMLGTPVGGGVVSLQFLHGVLALQRHFEELGRRLRIATIGDSLITRSRNALASAVVRDQDIGHLVMLDADVVVDPSGIERLVDSGHDVVGAVVALRRTGWQRVRDHLDACPDATAAEIEAIANDHAMRPLRGERCEDGFVPVSAVGSAAMVITRAALVELSGSDQVKPVAGGLPGPDGDGSGWTFFDPDLDADGRYLSEDFAFCARWRALGGKVWADLRTPTTHVGPVELHADVATSLRAATEARRPGRIS